MKINENIIVLNKSHSLSGLDLRQGQMLLGRVAGIIDSNHIKLSMAGTLVTARTTVGLRENSTIKLQVAGSESNQLILKVITEQSRGREQTLLDNAGKLLQKSNLKQGQAIQAALESLNQFANSRGGTALLLDKLINQLQLVNSEKPEVKAHLNSLVEMRSKLTFKSADPAIIREQLKEAMRIFYQTPEQMIKAGEKPDINTQSLSHLLNMIKASGALNKSTELSLQHYQSVLTGTQLLNSDFIGGLAQYFIPGFFDENTQVLINFKKRKREPGDEYNNILIRVDSDKLGKIEFDLYLRENRLTIKATVETEETKTLLEKNRGHLKNRINSLGFETLFQEILVAAEKTHNSKDLSQDLKPQVVKINILV